MEDLKHSKGNWTDELSDCKDTPSGKVKVSILDEDGIDISCIYFAGYSEETRANARLIAAAPQMLEFIQSVNKLANSIHFPTEQELKELAVNSKILIEKATKL